MTEEKTALATLVATRVADRVKIDSSIVSRALLCLAEGYPVPYLARYRRVDVGGLSEDALHSIRRAAEQVTELEKRREFVLRALHGRDDVPGKALKRISNARTRPELEYVYEPYRPHGRTSASIAREKGFAPLAESLAKGEMLEADDDAISGAINILAHQFAADSEARLAMFRAMEKTGEIRSAPGPGRKEFPPRYASLRNVSGRIAKIPAARLLALLRGEADGALQLTIDAPEDKVEAVIRQRHYPTPVPVPAAASSEGTTGETETEPETAPEAAASAGPESGTIEIAADVRGVLDRALELALRLMRTAVTRDVLNSALAYAEGAVLESACNSLRDQLLFPPAGARAVLGVDPSPRGSIPVAAVGTRGQPLAHSRPRFFGKDEEKITAGREVIRQLVDSHGIELIALGNGRGRQECETFLRETLAEREAGAPPCVVVSEAGLGSYASGPLARAELPSLPVPVIGAVAIARRLQDPLSEMTKLDPKQLVVVHGVADLDAARVTREFRYIVEQCVNRYGVDVNRAPAEQLAYVCGIGPTRAKEIVSHRVANGPYATREALRSLEMMDDKAFETGAGFLRIFGGENPLDATSIHPQRYPLVGRFAEKKGVDVASLIGNADVLDDLAAAEFADDVYAEPVVESVIGALLEAALQTRAVLEVAALPAGVSSASDLKSGMRLKGRVTNVTTFGAFVDLGVQQDGLVHVSELADKFVKDPSAVVHVGELVSVRVLGVDADTGKISLSMRTSSRPASRGGDDKRSGDRNSGDRKQGDRKPGGRRADGGGAGRGKPGGGKPGGKLGGGGGGGRDRRPRRGSMDREEREALEAMPRVSESDAGKRKPLFTPGATAENPVPADMTNEEFMQAKMEELKKRFG